MQRQPKKKRQAHPIAFALKDFLGEISSYLGLGRNHCKTPALCCAFTPGDVCGGNIPQSLPWGPTQN